MRRGEKIEERDRRRKGWRGQENETRAREAERGGRGRFKSRDVSDPEMFPSWSPYAWFIPHLDGF